MSKSYLVFLGLLITLTSSAQDLMKSRTTSPYTYFYSINDREALRIARKGALVKERDFPFIKVDSFPTGSVYQERLNPGNYLKAYIDRDKIDLEYICVPNVQFSVIQNQTDLVLQIRDRNGVIVTDAEVKIGSRHIPFDTRIMSYCLKKANSHGIVTINYDGMTSLVRLDRSYNNSGIRRFSRNVIYGSPVKYIWVPLRTAVVLPVDAVRSAIRGYGFGTAKSIWRWISRPFSEGRPSTGYVVFNKPKYNPGDTVMMKAFVLRGKNHIPLRKDADIKITRTDPYRMIKLGTIAPYVPGGYSYSFVLSDTLGLRLDNDYQVSISAADRYNTLVNGSFRYEYYDLKSLKLQLRVPEPVHYKGIPFIIGLKAVNESDMVLPDARTAIYILRDKVNEIFSSQLSISDTLTVLHENLQASGETLVEIPDSVFPDANLDYQIVAVTNTSDNESVIETKKVSYLGCKEEIEYTIEGDSIIFKLKVNGTGKVQGALLSSEDAFGSTSPATPATLPFSLRIDPFVCRYNIVSGNVRKIINVADIDPAMQCVTEYRNDSVIIRAQSHTGLSFNYFIYELNKEVERGTTANLDFRRQVTSDKRWYLSLNYLWGGIMNNSLYETGPQKDILNISVDQPEMILPGQKAKISLQVTDHKGLPVTGTDITAFSLTRKFGYKLPPLSGLALPQKRKALINNFKAATASDPDLFSPFRFDRWKDEAGLDTIEYFRFRYHTDEVRTFFSDMGDGITQFAPFIFKEGYPVKINHIYVDHRPLYFDIASANQPYSFRVDTGYHFVSIRTPYSIYEIDSLRFRAGKKLVLSIRDTDQPGDYLKKEAKPRLTDAERTRLSAFLLMYRPRFNNSIAYIIQNDNLFLLSDISTQLSRPEWNRPGYGNGVTGPLMQNKARFIASGIFQTDFDFEPYYEYDFAPGLLKMKSFKPTERIPEGLSLYSEMKDLKSSVLTEEYLDSIRKEILAARARSPFNYTRNEKTASGNGSVELMNIKDKNDRIPVANILFSESKRTLQTKRGYENIITNVSPGWYTYLAFYDGGVFCRIDSVFVTGNRKTFLDLSGAARGRDPDLFNRVVELINLPESGSRQLSSNERQLLQEFTRQEVNQYSGPGFTVTGSVISSDDNEPLPGVSIVCTRLAIGAVTDINGLYSIKLPFGVHSLSFNFIGMRSRDYEVSGDQTLEVTLEPDIMALEEVVVVGYGMTGKSSLTASVASVTRSLAGRVAGVTVTRNSGISIRGVSSLDTTAPPLIIIDGAPFTGDLSTLDPALLRSVKVLKDPSLVSLYGSRAANGVIMLTTQPGGVIVPASDKGVTFDDSFLLQAMAEGSLRRNFRDYAFWKPQLRTDDSGRVTFNASFPDDVTSWDTYFIAINGKRQAGATTRVIRAFRPVIAQLAAPKYFTEGDSVNLIGKIVNYTSSSAAIKESFINNGDTVFCRPRTLVDAIIDTIPVSVSENDSLRLEFSFATETGLKDGEYRPLPVNRAGIETDSGTFMIVEGDTTISIDLSAFSGDVTLTVVTSALDILRDNSYRLINYYYSCNEQMASKLIGILTAETINKALGEEKRKDEREAARLIKHLMDNRNEEGLWGWWGKAPTEEWISVHVLEALMLAIKHGHYINLDYNQVIDNAIPILESPLQQWRKLSLLEILSEMEAKADFNHYLQLIGAGENLSFTDSLRITALKQKYRLPVDLAFLERSRRMTLFGSVYFAGKNPQSQAMNNDVSTTLLAYKILKNDSTQTIADMAMVRNFFLETLTFGTEINTYQGAAVLNTILDDVLNETGKAKETRVIIQGEPDREIKSFPYITTLPPESSVRIKKMGPMPLFLNYSQKVFIKNPGEDTTDFRIKTGWQSASGTVRPGIPVSIKAEVDFFKSADYLVIEIPVPSGFSYNSKASKYAGEEHREFYRDHVAIFVRHADPGKRSYEIELMPRFSGKFILNPSKISLMYFPTIHSNDALKEVTIK